jgi:hypothetical protein
VELLKIEEAPPPTNVFAEIDENQDAQLSREEVGAASGAEALRGALAGLAVGLLLN